MLIWRIANLPHKVLTHWQKKERECDGGDDRRADGEQHLHRVEEEEHDQEGDGGAEGQAHGLDGVEGLNPARWLRLTFFLFAILVTCKRITW